MPWRILAAGLVGYLLGSIPFGYVLYRLRRGEDIRDKGSGNIGATNVLRVAGLAAGAFTLTLDAAKGYLAVLLAGRIAHTPQAVAAGALMSIVGHIYPLFLKFRGGKGVATALGAFLAISPESVLACALVFAAVVLAWRYVSLASMAAAGALPFVLVGTGAPSPILLVGTVAAALILYRHRSNYKRLCRGEETQITLRTRQSRGR